MSRTSGSLPSSQQKRELLTSLLRQRAAETTSSHPLSYGQKALWFLYQSAIESAAYNTAFTARIAATVDVPALRQAFQGLVDRHSSLRSTFCLRGGEVVQEVHRYQEVHFEQVYISDCSAETMNDRVAEEYRRPFDLEPGPALRVTLFTRSTRDHVLLMTVHHIVCDAWSLWLIADELHVLYSAVLEGKEAVLPPSAREYADYVQWQSKLLAGVDGERLWSYWRTELGSGVPALTMATDRPRPPVRKWQGDSYLFKLPDDLWRRLSGLAESEGVTLYVLLLAAFDVLLYRYTNQEEFAIGSPTTGRTEPDFAAVIGYFVNPVVLRANLAGNPTFQSFLKQVRKTTLGALANQDYPFPLLVEQLQTTRDRSRTPLMDVLFVFQKRQSSPVSASSTPAGFRLEPFDIPQMEGQFDLTLEITDGGKSVLKYDPALFDRETIVRMASHFQVLLQGIAANPAQQVSALPLLTAEERKRLLNTWNATEQPYLLDQCLHERFEAQVERTPDAIAAVFEGQQLTYRSLNAHSNLLAHRLRRLGIGPECLVGVCMQRSLEMVVALLGTLKAGGAYVPLDPSYPADRLNFMVRDSQVQVLLTHDNGWNHLSGIGSHCTCVDVALESVPEECARNPENRVVPENLAYMIYTSGSTGNPKGAMNTHRAIGNRLCWMQQEFRLTPADRVLQKTPFSFDVSVWEFFWPLITGACLVMAKPGGHQDCAYLSEVIQREKITVLHFVPSMLQIFVEEPNLDACDSLKQIFCSGEALPLDLQNRCQGRVNAELHNLYGPTEAAVDVTFWPCERDTLRRTVPIGRPIANTQIFILDRHLHPVPAGIPGELHIGGVNLGRGYFNRPDLTAERFVPNPFTDEMGDRLYKTGDLARFLPDGVIEYLGRIDHQVKVRGFRIELTEIESVLLKHPNVKETIVTTSEGPSGDKILVAYFVPMQDPAPTTSSLRRFLMASLPEYMTPSIFVELAVFPLTSSGKADRRALPSPERMRPHLENGYATPETQTERAIAEIWQQVLRLEKVGIHDNFFELGGHSLCMSQMIALVQERAGRSLSIVEAFEYPTVHTLARYLNGGEDRISEQGTDRANTRTAQKIRTEDLRSARRIHRATIEQ
jgi:amino acid adenylation domain-containing protein